MMMKEGNEMNPITLTEREYVTLVAGYTPDDEEIREFLAEYEDWLLGNQIQE
jgi:hypothetical protein